VEAASSPLLRLQTDGDIVSVRDAGVFLCQPYIPAMLNLPSLLVGLILVAYWGRVARMVRKLRRQTGQSANYVPRERLGLFLRLIWNPVVWVWIASPLANAFAGWAALPAFMCPLANWPVLAWFALAVAAGAFIATLVCWRKMGKSWRMGINPREKTQLVVSGPYAYVRHPIYALSSVLVVCTMIIIPSWLMLGAGAVHLLLLQWEARREESHLLGSHGEIYAAYRRQTGRFLPWPSRKYAG
jgi:protein-S-isoprenylcysteine O-methyltransferase Ste14